MKLRCLCLLALGAVCVAALCASPAQAAPKVTMRSDNAVVLRGVALEDVATSPSPYGSQAVRVAVDGYPMDAPVVVLCDGVKGCERVRRGDGVLVRGELRLDMADGKVYVVAKSLSVREAAR